MKKLLLSLFAAATCAFSSAQLKETVLIESNITSSATWTAEKIWLLKGIIRIQDGVTLTIEPGTVVKGGPAADGSNATCIVVEPGGKINAVGTKENPIVFTSSQPKGLRNYGDWGGIVMFGKAPVNKTNPAYEGGVIPGTYGGENPADTSGTLKYCRIEFAGYPFEQDRELNTLTMCGVGNGTSIEYIQASYNMDDAFEWFGGTVNCKHLIAYKTNDDDWDVDQGFSGKVQFGVSIADPNVADVSTKNGFEIDNDGSGSNDNPKTAAVFSNMTTIGAYNTRTAGRSSLHGRGGHIRRNSEVSIFNSIIMGWKEGIRMDGANTFSNYDDGAAFLQNNILAGNVIRLNVASGVDSGAFASYVYNAANSNRILDENSQVMLQDPFNYAQPDWRPKAGSPALNGAAFANGKLSDPFFTSTSYVGAFAENDNWHQGWTEWDPVNAEYDYLPGTAVTKPGNVLNMVAYPNPTSGAMSLEFDLAAPEAVTVEVLDLTGKVIKRVLEHESMAPGAQRLDISLSEAENGIYFILIRTETGVKSVKTIVNK
jgi:hypothetical protein